MLKTNLSLKRKSQVVKQKSERKKKPCRIVGGSQKKTAMSRENKGSEKGCKTNEAYLRGTTFFPSSNGKLDNMILNK